MKKSRILVYEIITTVLSCISLKVCLWFIMYKLVSTTVDIHMYETVLGEAVKFKESILYSNVNAHFKWLNVYAVALIIQYAIMVMKLII